MKTRKKYLRPSSYVYSYMGHAIMNFNSDENLPIRNITEGDASTAQTKGYIYSFDWETEEEF